VADLDALRELHRWMREENILYARTGTLELRLEPKPPAPAKVIDEQPVDPERSALEELLHSSGLDVGPLLEAMRRPR